MAETIVVDEFQEALKKAKYSPKIFQYDREGSRDEELHKRFKGSSKQGTGNIGRCDLVLYSKSEQLIIIVEAKRDVKNHGSEEDKNIADKAIPGVRHYMKHLWENGLGMHSESIIGIAVSGVKDQKVTMFGICNVQHRKGIIKKLSDTLLEYNDAVKALYSLDNIPGVPSIKGEGQTTLCMEISKLSELKINNSMQRYFNRSHSQEILESMITDLKQSKLVLMGTLIVAIYNKEYHIIDGQHRYHAYLDLQKSNEDFKVIIQTITVSTKEEVEELYNRHYKALEPIEEDKTIKERQWYYILSHQVFEKLKLTFNLPKKSIVNNSTSAPYITVRTQMPKFSEYLQSKESLYRNVTADEIMVKLLAKNSHLSNKIPTNRKSKSTDKYAEKILQIAKDCNCWLGLIHTDKWLEPISD